MSPEFQPQASRLPELLREERAAILDAWEEDNRAHHDKAREFDRKQLRDHIPPLLDEIVGALEASAAGEEVSLTHQTPRKHAQHRLAVGFTLDVVTQEYALLRKVMIERLYARIDNVPVESVQILHRFIDQAVLEAVMAFSEGAQAQREREQARRSEFERHLLGIVSHDLRTPLQAITASAGLLLRSPALDDRQLRLLTGITSSVSRANRLIQDLVDFTAMRLGEGFKIIPTEVDLQALAQQAITELQLNHPEREIRLEEEGDLQGRWDGERLTQVLTNMLTNALKYSTGHSAIRVHIAGQGDEVQIKVHNFGPPIPEDVQQRLFEPMARGEGESSRTQGLGLGLYIARHIIEAHDGRVDVDSSEEKGTTFTMRLPRVAKG